MAKIIPKIWKVGYKSMHRNYWWKYNENCIGINKMKIIQLLYFKKMQNNSLHFENSFPDNLDFFHG